MSLVTGTARTGEAAAIAEAPLFNGTPLILGVLAINVFYVGVRIYEQVFGQFAGLDSFAPEFTTYWMTILYIEEPVELISFLALVGWMWKTRDTDLEHVQARDEMRRLFYLMAWILIRCRDLLGRQLLHGAGRHLAYDGDPRHRLHA
jgi:methane/ammonia monooxygenase subunit C